MSVLFWPNWKCKVNVLRYQDHIAILLRYTEQWLLEHLFPVIKCISIQELFWVMDIYKTFMKTQRTLLEMKSQWIVIILDTGVRLFLCYFYRERKSVLCSRLWRNSRRLNWRMTGCGTKTGSISGLKGSEGLIQHRILHFHQPPHSYSRRQRNGNKNSSERKGLEGCWFT